MVCYGDVILKNDAFFWIGWMFSSKMFQGNAALQIFTLVTKSITNHSKIGLQTIRVDFYILGQVMPAE